MPKEIDYRHISELLFFLLEEREKIEQTGYRLDHDHMMTWKYINKKIQKLNLLSFQHEYNEYRQRIQNALDKSKKGE